MSETTHPSTTVTARWTFQDLATGLATGCPAGFDIARLVATPADGGDAITTDFACAAARGTGAALAPAVYDLAIEIRAEDGTLYARSLSTRIDLTGGGDHAFATTIVNDAGYAHVAWTLVGGASGAMLTCADGLVDAIVVTSRGATASYVDQLPCEDEAGLTRALAPGSYAFTVAASHLGTVTGQAMLTGDIDAQNQVTQLGSVPIALSGQ